MAKVFRFDKKSGKYEVHWIIPQERNSSWFERMRTGTKADEQTTWLENEDNIRRRLVTMGEYSRSLKGYQLQSDVPGFFHEDCGFDDEDATDDGEHKDESTVPQPLDAPSSPSDRTLEMDTVVLDEDEVRFYTTPVRVLFCTPLSVHTSAFCTWKGRELCIAMILPVHTVTRL
jgi:hypothetical protein